MTYLFKEVIKYFFLKDLILPVCRYLFPAIYANFKKAYSRASLLIHEEGKGYFWHTSIKSFSSNSLISSQVILFIKQFLKRLINKTALLYHYISGCLFT